jgi:PAS domain S-box-containing protein
MNDLKQSDRSSAPSHLAEVAWHSPLALGSFELTRDGYASVRDKNPAFATLFGAEQSVEILAGAHPDDRAVLRASLEEAARTFSPWERSWRHRHPARGEIWVEGKFAPHLSAEGGAIFCGGVRDVSEERSVKAALEESDRRFRHIAGTANYLFWIMDLLPEPHVPYVNDAFEHIWGRKPEEAYADPRVWTEAIHPVDRERVISAHDAWLADPDVMSFEEEYRIERPDGGIRWIYDRGHVVRDPDGQVRRITGIAEDITVRKRYELEARQLNSQLEERVRKRTEALRAANEELEAFSYSVSHDLRAPLRTIDGFAQAAIEDFSPELPTECQRYLRIVREGAQRMGQLIDDLLRFSHLSRQLVQKRTVDMCQLATQCLDELASQRAGREVTVEVGALPECAGDPNLLNQVWYNLLSNALKYTTMRAQAKIEVGAQQAPGQAPVYFVRDNGAGFDMAYAKKLFGVFQRLHREEEFEGTGVGLAIVQRIVHRHGGRVWAEAAPDRGACFFFTVGEGEAAQATDS